jgi:hypothetical protein
MVWPAASIATASAPHPATDEAALQTSPVGSYSLTFIESGGGGGFGESLTLSSDGSSLMMGCPGLWSQFGKEIAIETQAATCYGEQYVFVGKMTSKGLCTAKKPCSFTAAYPGPSGPVNGTGTWYAIAG